MTSKMKQYNFTQELEMVLSYSVEHITQAPTKAAAEEETEFAGYLLKLVVNRYYGNK